MTNPEIASRRWTGTIISYGVIMLIAYLAFRIFEPFFVALAWAAVLVVVSYRAYEWLARRMRPSLAALASTLGVTVVLIAPAVLILLVFLSQGSQALQSLHLETATTGHIPFLHDIWAKLQARFPELNSAEVTAEVHHYGEQAAQFLASRLGTAVRHTAEFVFDLFITVFAMFYMFRDGQSFVSEIRRLLPLQSFERERILDDTRDIIFATVFASFLAAAAHGTLLGLVFRAFGIHASLFWGVMMGFFSLIPVVGSALIWVPAAIGLMVSGHVGKGVALALIAATVVIFVDYVLRPWFISGRAQVGELLVFIGVLGGITVFGALGIVLGPIVVGLAADLMDLYSPRRGRPGHTVPPPGANPTGAVLE
ncbi:MAG: AI-2E family transporter [Candidatus Acidiferrales bacterium]